MKILKQDPLDRDFKETFGTPHGERVLHNLVKTTGSLLANKPTDALSMAYKEGQRSVIIHIYSKLNRKINEPKQERAINEQE